MQTKGEQIIGTFNPSGDDAINLIKTKAAELINLIEDAGRCPRRKAAAITDIEKGAMMAVKSLFHNQ